MPGFCQAAAAKVLGIEPAKVIVNNHIIGGGFGGRLEAAPITTATRIAQKVDGPVKIIWSREEDIRQDWSRPLYHDRLKARVEDGKITAWHHRVTAVRSSPIGCRRRSRTASTVTRSTARSIRPYGSQHPGRVHPPRERGPVLVLAGVGPNSSVFSVECFLDLIAKKTGADPVAFRRGMLDHDPRALGVLDAVAKTAAWGTPAPASPGMRTGGASR